MKHQDIIKQMTLEEKCSLLSGSGNFTSKAIQRLGVPSMFLSDGPHGVRKQDGATDHLGLNPSQPATCYPTAATIANSWDESLAEAVGAYLGEESVALGVNVLLGPGLNMKRSPLGGRNFEYFSEDPYLAGKFAAAYIRGIQSMGVAACPKHFAANSQELRRMHSDSVLDERTLREIYLTGFEIAVKEGNPLSIMSAYNKMNGIYASEDKHLLRDVLVDEWGFDGFVVTDWGGSDNRVAGLLAGNHLEMPATQGQSDMEVALAVQDGTITEELLDQRISDYLDVLFKTQIQKTGETFDQKANHAFARKAAEDSIVLLKNENDILPLPAKTKVAVIGDFAQTPRYQGAGSSLVNSTIVDIPLDCLLESPLEVVGYQPGFLRHSGSDPSKVARAVELAGMADVILLYLGLDEFSEIEGMDRPHMKLNDNQLELLDAVHEANQQIVVVLCGATPIETPWLHQCKGLVHGYLGGQAGASAMVDVLCGQVNPSGKLAESWPMVYEDTPCHRYFPGEEKTAEYRESIFIGYRYYTTAGVATQFPFGYGLSYTTFSYQNIVAEESTVTFTVTNTGQLVGAEIAQIYIGKPKSSLIRAVRELKGFVKVFLQPGESKTVTVNLDDKAFRYFNVSTNQFEIEPGEYLVEVGASVDDIRLSAEVSIKGSIAAMPYDKSLLPSYDCGKITDIGDREFQLLLNRPIPQHKWDRNVPLERNDTFSQLFYAKGWVGRLVYRLLSFLKRNAEQKGQPDLNILFIFNLPFRGIAKMMMGAVDMAMAEALLEIFNGHFFKGSGHLISAWFRKGKAAKENKKKLELANQHNVDEGGAS